MALPRRSSPPIPGQLKPEWRGPTRDARSYDVTRNA
jgi:hypothetical protein